MEETVSQLSLAIRHAKVSNRRATGVTSTQGYLAPSWESRGNFSLTLRPKRNQGIVFMETVTNTLLAFAGRAQAGRRGPCAHFFWVSAWLQHAETGEEPSTISLCLFRSLTGSQDRECIKMVRAKG